MNMRVNEAAKRLGVSPWTVRNYCNDGRLESNRTPGGHRNITEEQLKRFQHAHGMTPNETQLKTAHYARSSNGNKELIQAQLNELEQTYGTPTITYTDKGSGLNENRPSLWKMIREAENGNIDRICVTYQDRLTRFGNKSLQHIIEHTGCELIILHDKKKYSIEQELMDDFMSLIASFSGRFYRMRGKKQQKQLLDDAAKRIDHEQEEK